MECEIQGIPIYYETIGDGRPFLMLHGGYVDHRHMIDDFEPIFARHPNWKRIYLDLPGHGRTSARDWLINHDQVLDITLSFIDQVIPDQSFALAGVSRGGYLIRGILAKRPATVAGALFVVPARYAVAAADSLPQKIILIKDNSVLSELKPSETAFFEGYVVQNRKALEAMRKVALALELTDYSFQDRILQNYEFSFDVDQLPVSFEKPVLIVVGKQDAVVGYVDAWKMLKQFPRATFAVLDKAGHYLGIEQDELLHALAAEWLQRVEEYQS
jgi:pimeloyl-ACP methyl ester carboxylesterase